jgi:hypothetical protein
MPCKMREPPYDVTEPIMDWTEFNRDRWAELDPDLRLEAAEKLREVIEFTGMGEELKARILEKPDSWISGRDDAPCPLCEGSGQYRRLKPGVLSYSYTGEDFHKAREDEKNLAPPEMCTHCDGGGRAPEMPLHMGFGMSVRNYLRQNGFGEDTFGVWNLDDYYIPLVERAAMDDDWFSAKYGG